MTLQQIGEKYKTDKAITHFYMDTYEKYFAPWRDKNIVLLELGVAGGASIQTWREFFPKAKVYGIDLNPDCAGEGIFIGSQIDHNFLSEVIYAIGKPNIIIDDASHYAPYTIDTFEYLFPKMAKGGYYVIEDTHCFYDRTYGLAPPFEEGASEIFQFFTSLACDVDVHGRAMTGNAKFAIDANIDTPPVPQYSRILDSIHIHPSLWFFKRK